MTDELCFLGIAECARRIAGRRLSPVELTQAYLDRIAAVDGVIDSYLCVTADRALTEAKQAEAEIARGAHRGPMHGIPFALKDIYDTAGIATTGHSALCRDRVPDADAAVVAKLGQAGAVLLGKLATHEFATGGPSYDLPWRPARNPWKLDRFPGGSSSGSGAAVAAALAPVAMGSDTGGSIRLPAAFCGVAGIKPTYGRVSKRGVLPLSWTMDNCGPLAWDVEDCAIVLQAIAGHDPQDPCSADVPVPDFRAGLDAGVKGLRIGFVRHFYETDRRAGDDVIVAMDAAAAVFASLGAEVRDVTLQPLADYQACFRIIAIAESFAIHGETLGSRPDLYGEVLRYRLLPGSVPSGADYIQAQRQQRAMLTEMLATLRDVDVLVTATAYGEAPVMAAMRAEANFAQPPLTPPFNVGQLPTISICNGFSRSGGSGDGDSGGGLPLSMQIAGRPFDEAIVFRVARAYERATPWRERRPEIAGTPVSEMPCVHDPRTPHPEARERCRMLVRGAGLDLEGRQLDQLCEAAPYVEAMAARLPRARPFTDEPANIFTFPQE